jgi:isoaspartyl peptidase/L-asparaginase-like protein (Ntn-hydrolase superfamily)
MALTRLGLNQSINLASNVTGTLATGNGGTGATSFSPGKVGQVINAQQGYFQTNSTSFVDTGLTASITPSATSSKVLVVVSLSGCSSTDQADTSLEARLLRDSSEIIVFETIGGILLVHHIQVLVQQVALI